MSRLEAVPLFSARPCKMGKATVTGASTALIRERPTKYAESGEARCHRTFDGHSHGDLSAAQRDHRKTARAARALRGQLYGHLAKLQLSRQPPVSSRTGISQGLNAASRLPSQWWSMYYRSTTCEPCCSSCTIWHTSVCSMMVSRLLLKGSVSAGDGLMGTCWTAALITLGHHAVCLTAGSLPSGKMVKEPLTLFVGLYVDL
jgi:hypothetical protein